jgi:hypothetical protein
MHDFLCHLAQGSLQDIVLSFIADKLETRHVKRRVPGNLSTQISYRLFCVCSAESLARAWPLPCLITLHQYIRAQRPSRRTLCSVVYAAAAKCPV